MTPPHSSPPHYDDVRVSKDDTTPPAYTAPMPPSYQPTLSYFGLSLMKIELNSPYNVFQNKEWQPVLLELNSTQLNVYALNVEKRLNDLILALYHGENSLEELMYTVSKSKGLTTSKQQLNDLEVMFGDAYGGEDSNSLMKSKSHAMKSSLKKFKISKSLKDLKEFYTDLKDNKMLFEATKNEWDYQQFLSKYRGQLLHSWTLNRIQIGEAPSIYQVISSLFKEDDAYKNQNIETLQTCKNVLRVRIEVKQVLFQMWSFHGMVHWYRNLKIGRDLCMDLDYRLVVKLKSLPRRNNQENNAMLVAAEAAAFSDNFGDDLLETQFFREKYRYNQEDDASSCQDSGSVETSLFDRPPTLLSLASTDSGSVPTKTFQAEFKLVSLSKYYNNFEFRCISNCISNLNSFEKWVGQSVTVLNYKKYIDTKTANNIQKDGLGGAGLDILITKSMLNLSKGGLFKRKHQGLYSDMTNREFLVHENGLVSLGFDHMKPVEVDV